MPKRPLLPEPPEGLSQRALELWHSIVPRRARSTERLAALEQALRALDRADEARRIVKIEGMTTKTETTGAVHVHPLVKIERESRQQFLRAWEALGLASSMEIDGVDP